jgi:hypothetical protein
MNYDSNLVDYTRKDEASNVDETIYAITSASSFRIEHSVATSNDHLQDAFYHGNRDRGTMIYSTRRDNELRVYYIVLYGAPVFQYYHLGRETVVQSMAGPS